MIKELYHGTNSIFSKFNPKFLDSDGSNNQYGSGYYFYDNIEYAYNYGNNIIIVNCDIKNILNFDSNDYKLNFNQVKKLILKSPELNNCLENYGDINNESFSKILNRTINLYHNIDNIIHLLNIVGNDFFKKENTHILLKEFIKITKFNCIEKKFENNFSIYVMLNEEDINITKIISGKYKK